MLQRIQSIYLFIAILLSGLVSFWLPFWAGEKGDILYLGSMLEGKELLNLLVPAFFIISGLLSFLSLISYKNRTRQIINNRINIVINFFLLGTIVYHLLKLPGEINVSEKGIGVFIPLVVIVFLALANKAIIKDDKLVKSVDRLR